MFLSRGNHKLARNVMVWNLPAVTTCMGSGVCESYCYAKKGERRFSQVKPSRENNFKDSISPDFVNNMVNKLNACRTIDVVRIHASGDFYSQEYLDKWKDIARQVPTKVFSAFTKSFNLELYDDAPENLVIMQSSGSKWDDMMDSKCNTARVIDDISDVRDYEYLCPYHEETFEKCNETCSYCFDINTVKHIAFLRH